MSDRDDLQRLLAKYEAGTATDAEIKQVHEKLKDFETFQDDLTKDNEFSVKGAAELSVPELDPHKFKRQARRRWLKLGGLILVSLLVILSLINWLILPLADRFYYDPRKTAENSPLSEYQLYASVYTELTDPVYRLNSVMVADTGVGSYRIESTDSAASKVLTTQTRTVTTEITRNQINNFSTTESDPSQDLTAALRLPTAKEVKARETWTQQTKEKVADLPASSVVSGKLTFKKALTIKQVFQMFGVEDELAATDIKVYWSVVDTGKINNDFGFDWYGSATTLGSAVGQSNSYLRKLDQKYPELFFAINQSREIYNPAKVQAAHFKSGLKYLIDQQKTVGKYTIKNRNPQEFARALKYVEQHGVKIRGVYLDATAKKFTALADNANVAAVEVIGAELYNESFNNPEK